MDLEEEFYEGFYENGTEELPVVLDDPKTQVYLPIATTQTKGIASFDAKDFNVDPTGKVALNEDLHQIKENTDTALEKSQEGLSNSEEALSTANTALSAATEALSTANGIDGKATEALSTANEALEQVVEGLGSKVYVNGVLESSVNVDKDIQEQFNEIDELIPPQASPENPLTDQEFVNSSIATNTATFIGTFPKVESLLEHGGVITNNDYAFVINSTRDFASTTEMNAYDKTLLTNFDYGWVPNNSNYDLYRFNIVIQTWELRATNIEKSEGVLNTAYNRYKAVVNENIVTWNWEYTLNNSSFTATQWAAINSGITNQELTDIKNSILAKADRANNLQLITAGALKIPYTPGKESGRLQFYVDNTTIVYLGVRDTGELYITGYGQPCDLDLNGSLHLDELFFGDNRVMNNEGVFFFQNNSSTPESMTAAPILASKILLGAIGGPRIETINDNIRVVGNAEFSGSINLI